MPQVFRKVGVSFIVKWKTGRHIVWRWTCLVALSLTPKKVNNLQNTTQTYNNSCSRVLSGWPTLALIRQQIFLRRFSYVLSFARDEPSSEPGAPDDIVWRPVLRRRVLQHRRAASRYLQVLQYPSSSPVGYCLSLLLFQAQHDTQFSDTAQRVISYHNILLHISSTARFLNTCLRVKEACCLHPRRWSSQKCIFWTDYIPTMEAAKFTDRQGVISPNTWIIISTAARISNPGSCTS